jgi:hypothetical protein
MQFKVSEKFKNYLFLEDFITHKPEYDPLITIALSKSAKEFKKEINGEFEESIMLRAFLVPKKQKKIAIGRKFNISEISDGRDFFDDDGNYNPGETFVDEESGVNFEIIVNVHTFEGIEKSLYYFEPTDRLIRYLRLHRENDKWINPQTGDSIIEKEDKQEGAGHLKLLKIRKSELIDYLAARKCGLLLLRYAERMITTPTELVGLPKSFEKKRMKNGRMDWIAEDDPANPQNKLYFSRLWDSFWIDPAKKPRRWDAESHEERKNTVSFQQEDGEYTTYTDAGENFFKIISFHPSLFRSFLSSPNNKIKFYSISTLGLEYSDGTLLDGCINREGQFQVFFGDIDKNLDVAKQRKLAGYSEPLKAKISSEYCRTKREGMFPKTTPFKWTVCKSLDEINTLWTDKFGKSLLLSPKEDNFKDHLLIGPTSHDIYELVDIMLEIRKLIIPDYKIDKIKNQLNYSSLASDKNLYKNLLSIGFTKLFFKANRKDGTEGESYILSLINELRQCKGHIKDPNKVLSQYNIKEGNPRKLFLFIMKEICGFLIAFKSLTEKNFSQKTATKERIDPWNQLKLAQNYFKTPH